ncbi:MAG: hypothetical protein ABIP35_05140 [Ginsengibacter sp.]
MSGKHYIFITTRPAQGNACRVLDRRVLAGNPNAASLIIQRFIFF